MSDAAEEVQVKEGQATLYFASKKGVFYNPPQIPNRDLSVLALQQFSEMWASQPSKPAADRHRTLRQGSAPAPADAGAPEAAAAQEPPAPAAGEASETATAEAPTSLPASASKPAARRGLRVLDALSASGLRTIRYAKEVSGLREVVANDVDPVAHQTMASNFGRNGLLEGGGEQSCRVTSTVGDAAALLYASRPPAGERFDVVDLDPYGTASPFLDGAVQAVSEGGLLMVTCTDMAVLAGAYPEAGAEACFAKYGAWPLKGKHCHEQGLRILLACIDSHAARHGRYITPLLSVHINFYVRVFVRLRSSKAAVGLDAHAIAMRVIVQKLGLLEIAPASLCTEVAREAWLASLQHILDQ
ncbi:putative N2,N2-dimethylguanosine tRNA methyltransferase, partial [Emiliania huxleyi CCMP1516]|uniref:tRNA (guanine(26)-N(2))-dimethyltransferase n=2 Tax=Emiliania huxleyi TaxID=2903 RepID=A0A0D3IGJ6_EMIH1